MTQNGIIKKYWINPREKEKTIKKQQGSRF